MRDIDDKNAELCEKNNRVDNGSGTGLQQQGSRYIAEKPHDRVPSAAVLNPGIDDCPDKDRNLVMFFSYSIAHEAAYEEIGSSGYYPVLPGLFHYLEKNMQRIEVEKGLKTEIWKIVGDEIIFSVELQSAEDIAAVLYCANETLLTVNTLLRKKTLPADLSADIPRIKADKMRFKAVAWVAIVNKVTKHRAYCLDPSENLYMGYRKQSVDPFGEYYGIDIDTGNRLKEYTRANRMAVSFELAYLLFKKGEGRYLQIISYEPIQGMWSGHGYPIIWYHRHQGVNYVKSDEHDFENTFTYDAGMNDELVRNYLMMRQVIRHHNAAYPIAPERFIASEQTMNKIAVDVGILGKLEKMQEMLNRTGFRYTPPETDFMKVDCAAICYCTDRRGQIQLLAVKTSGSNPGDIPKWCFGSADAYIEKTLTTSLVEQYKEDINLDIAPLVYDEEGSIRESTGARDETEEPIPIALFDRNCVSSEGGVRKGIICVAKINGKSKVPRCDGIYSSYRYFTEAELTSLSGIFGEDRTVNGFERNARLALRLIHEYEG